MEYLKILPEITEKLNKDPNSIIKEVMENIEILGYHLNPLNINNTDKRLYLLLSQIYFIQRNYKKCIEFAIKSNISIGDDFFSKCVFFRMLDEYKKSKDLELRRFLGEVYRGYLFDCGELKEFKEDFETYGVCKRDYERIILLDGFGSMEFMKMYCDGCIFYGEYGRINELLSRLTGTQLFELAFYCQDNSFFKFESKNEMVQKILSGEFKSKVISEYLKNNMRIETDFLENAGRYLSHKNSVTHMIVGFSMALNALGSVNDSFFRVNSDLFLNSKLWSKFTILGSFGLFQAHNADIFDSLQNILPNEQANSYEGGSLCALGIAHVGWNTPSDVSFLLNFIGISPEVSYGAILGLGLVSMGSRDPELTKKMEEIIEKSKKMNDNEDTSENLSVEAACIALSQIWIGSGNKSIVENLEYLLKNSKYERICRSAGVGISMVMMGRESVTIKNEKSWIEKYSKCLELGCSFVNSQNHDILEQLLKFTNDLSGDVRRAAIFSIGLLYCGDTDSLFEILKPFFKSYCLYIRHSVALTLGIFFCGTGNKKVYEALEVLLYDEESLVRQAASIGLGFVLMQNNGYIDGYYRIMEKINTQITKKHEGIDAKMGAIMSRSIALAGGTNIIFTPFNISGKISYQHVSGLLLFFEFWFWYPYINYLGISYIPTSKFIFNTELQPVSKTFTIDGYPLEFDITPVPFRDFRRRRRQGKKTHIVYSKDRIVKHHINSGSRMWLKAKDRLGDFKFEFVE